MRGQEDKDNKEGCGWAAEATTALTGSMGHLRRGRIMPSVGGHEQQDRIGKRRAEKRKRNDRSKQHGVDGNKKKNIICNRYRQRRQRWRESAMVLLLDGGCAKRC
jgi:hypothetical protein